MQLKELLTIFVAGYDKACLWPSKNEQFPKSKEWLTKINHLRISDYNYLDVSGIHNKEGAIVVFGSQIIKLFYALE